MGTSSRPSRAALAVVLFLPMVGSTLSAAAEGGGKKGKPFVPVRLTIAPGKRDPWIDPVLAEPVPVVVYGEPRLDARDIDPASLVLSGAAAAKDVDGSLAAYRDVDGDGLVDLVLRFPSTRMHLSEQSTRAVLGGRTTDGRLLRGTAPIATLDRARAEHRRTVRFDAGVEKLPAQMVRIDVLPEDPTNRIELGNRGTVAVAVLSDPAFDATHLDPLSLHLAGAPVTRRAGGGLASLTDVNGDGRADLVVDVPRKLLRLDADSREAVLTGFTAQGRALWGSDPIAVADTATMVFDSDEATGGPEPSAVDFTNNLGITINDVSPATPYPSTINVLGLPGVISKVRVTLRGLSHTFPNDIDVLLVGPTGQNLVLMSDVGGSGVVANVALTFDDDAASRLDPAVLATTGTYRPINFTAGDPFPAPAPASTAATALSAFTGTNPNGTWSLYVVDDQAGDVGTIAGWSIDFVLASEFCTGGSLTINDNAPGAPYPATIAVAGLSGIVSKVTASLRGVTHTFPDDIDLLLVGPTGLATMALSDTGGTGPGVAGVSLVLDDNAPLTLDPGTNPASGTYQPGDGIPGESLPAPAPAGPYPVGFRAYSGTNPNGTWNVYVADDAAGDVGSIGRLCLAITTMTPIDDSNLTAITIPAGAPGVTQGPAGPYPSTINVTGVIGTLQKATVSLRPVSHTFPQDLDILLVGPSGGNVLLMSDVGGVNPGVAGAAYTFDDDAAGSMPVAVNPASGTYKPTNDDSGGADVLPGPAPAGPYGATLGGLAGLSPNGGWRLFVFDDAGGDVGSLASGWSLTLRTWLRGYGGCNFSAMTIPAGAPGTTSGPSSAYPVGIVQVAVPVDLDQYKVRIDLLGVTHTYPRDLDVLIVGPTSQKVLLMSDAAGTGPGINNVNLSFDDDAAAGLLQFTNPTAGVYRPSDFEPGDVMPAPAPAGPYATSLSAFKGTNPLGAWALYVADDAVGDVGSLSGWCLNFVPSISAGVTPNLRWTDKTTVVWDAAFNATSYNLYRGDPSQLPALVDHGIDGCARGTTLTQQMGPLAEVPALGSFYWYLVRGSNAQGEGPAGFDRLQGLDLARIQDSSGVCP